MKPLSIIIIDDDPICQLIDRKVIHRCDPDCIIIPFLDPEIAVDYFVTHQNDEELLPDVVLLDLNMPQLDGWQVLDRLGMLDLKKDIYIQMLTSSVDPKDKTKASQYELISSFESKPLSKESFSIIKEEVLRRRK